MNKFTIKQARLHVIRARRSQKSRTRKTQKKKLLEYTSLERKAEFGKEVLVRAVIGGKEKFAICLNGIIDTLPERLSFRENAQETVSFLTELRKGLGAKSPIRAKKRFKGAKIPVLNGYWDFSTLKFISTSCALILSAEYQRAWYKKKVPPPLINVHMWSPEVVNKLREIGFFQILNIEESVIADIVPESSEVNSDVKTLKFMSGENSEQLEEADRQLISLCEYLNPGEEVPEDILVALNSAISEAMVNVRQHAYPVSHDFSNYHLNRYWFAGAANKTTRRISISMYDQGASIPVTYPNAKMVDKVMNYLKSFSGLDGSLTPNDGAYIAAATKYGNSQVGAPHRGKGLPQIKSAVDCCKNGMLMIMSRAGKFVYEYGNEPVTGAFKGSVGGTLITWSVVIPSPDRS